MGFLKNWLDKKRAKKIAYQLCSTDQSFIKKGKVNKRKKSSLTIDELREKIAQEAYQLAQKNGFNPAFDEENWVAAEKKVLESVKPK